MHVLGIALAAIALVPAPKELTWREGTCSCAEKDIRHVRDVSLPPEGYRLDIAPDGVTVASGGWHGVARDGTRRTQRCPSA